MILVSPRHTSLLVAATLAFSLVTFTARLSLAQDPAIIDKLVQLNKKAMDDYDTADFDSAKRSLLDAEKAGKRAGLETHPVMARTYVHLGAVYLLGYKDKAKAQHYFDKALDIEPGIKLDRNLTSQTVRDAFDAVVAKRGGDTGAAAASSAPPPPKASAESEAAPPPTEAEAESGAEPRRRAEPSESEAAEEEPDLPSRVVALDCPYPGDIPPGKKLTLRCVAAENLGVANVNLYYKGYHMEDYDSIAMEHSPKGWWQAVVPKNVIQGKSLQFYFEGVDSSDKPVISNGRPESPNVLVIANRTAGRGRIRREEENPLAEDEDIEGRKYGNRRFYFGIGFGTGVVLPFSGKPEALVNSYADQTHSPMVSGPSWAGLLHAAPVIGIQFNPHIGLSLEGRDQYILRPNGVSSAVAASGAHSVLLKLLYYTHQQRARFFFGGGGGGGEGIRGIVMVKQSNGSTFQDTIRIGPILITGTAGFIYEIAKSVSWIAQLNAYVGLPNAGIGADFNTGVQFNFGDSSGRAEAAAKARRESLSGSVEDDDEPQ